MNATLFEMPTKREPTAWELLMKGLRDLGYEMSRTTGSVAKAMRRAGVTDEEILHMAEGQVILARTGVWDMTPPYPLLPLWSRKLNSDRKGAPWQTECLNAYYRNQRPTKGHGMKRIRITFE